MADEDDCDALVIDGGSWKVKAGYAGDDRPRAVFPTVMGTEERYHVTVGMCEKSPYYFGDGVAYRREHAKGGTRLRLSYPMEDGVVTNWEVMEKIWHHTFFNELRVDACEQPVLFSASVRNPKENQEKLQEIMFETFAVPALKIVPDALLPLRAAGLKTGVVVTCGHGSCFSVPIQNGKIIDKAVQRLALGGQHLTDGLMKIMEEHGYEISTQKGQEVAEDIKVSLGRAALDFEKEMVVAAQTDVKTTDYRSSDDRVFKLGNELFRCIEPIWQPSLLGLSAKGLHRCIFDSIEKCEPAVRNELYSNILLAGGTSLSSGFSDRLHKELTALTPTGTVIKIDAQSHRLYTTWIGGSIYACQLEKSGWFTRSDYEEN